MFEKVNPSHPDKIADRIAGAVVDLAYRQTKNPRIALEVLIGHKVCNIIAETSVSIPESAVIEAAQRIAGNVHVVLPCFCSGHFIFIEVKDRRFTIGDKILLTLSVYHGNYFPAEIGDIRTR